MPVFRKGDTVSQVAARNNMSVQKFLALNPQITNPNRIKPDQSYNLGSKGRPVAKGETFSSIAPTLGMSPLQLMQLNPKIDPRKIPIGYNLNLEPEVDQVPIQEEEPYTPWTDNAYGLDRELKNMQLAEQMLQLDRKQSAEGMGSNELDLALLTGGGSLMRSLAKGVGGRVIDDITDDADTFSRSNRRMPQPNNNRTPYDIEAQIRERVAQRVAQRGGTQNAVKQTLKDYQPSKLPGRRVGSLEQELAGLRSMEGRFPWEGTQRQKAVPPVIPSPYGNRPVQEPLSPETMQFRRFLKGE
jgi:LysM repeat protein